MAKQNTDSYIIKVICWTFSSKNALLRVSILCIHSKQHPYHIEWVSFITYVPTQCNKSALWLLQVTSYYYYKEWLVVVSCEQFVNKLPILEFITRRRDQCHATKTMLLMDILNMNLHYIYNEDSFYSYSICEKTRVIVTP